MINPFRKSRESKQRAEDTEKILDALADKVEEQKPRVNELTGWLEARKLSNGFGLDFEWTLTHPRRARG